MLIDWIWGANAKARSGFGVEDCNLERDRRRQKLMCTPYSSHLPALVRLNQAEKDNEAFYLDATDFIYSPRDLQLFVFEFEAPTLSVQGSSHTGGEKIEENQKKCGIHKRGSVVEAYSRQGFTALCLPGTHSCCSELEQGSSYKEKNCKATSQKIERTIGEL